MNIDEAIKKHKTMATKGNVIFSQNPDFAKRSDEEHGQIAEWLEQLKNYWELEEQDKKKEDCRKRKCCLRVILGARFLNKS